MREKNIQSANEVLITGQAGAVSRSIQLQQSRRVREEHGSEELKAGQPIAGLMGQPISVGQRWAVGWDAMQPANRLQIAMKETDLGAELKHVLSY